MMGFDDDENLLEAQFRLSLGDTTNNWLPEKKNQIQKK